MCLRGDLLMLYTEQPTCHRAMLNQKKPAEHAKNCCFLTDKETISQRNGEYQQPKSDITIYCRGGRINYTPVELLP